MKTLVATILLATGSVIWAPHQAGSTAAHPYPNDTPVIRHQLPPTRPSEKTKAVNAAAPAYSMLPSTAAAGASIINASPYADYANLRYCPGPGYVYYQVDAPCNSGSTADNIITQIPNGSEVIMRCWIDTVNQTDQNPTFTSPRWFYVTDINNNPEYSGFVYSDLVSNQTRTPACGNGSPFMDEYPYDPSQGSISIGVYGNDLNHINLSASEVAEGATSVYCHNGNPGSYPLGGTVTYLGSYNLSGTNEEGAYGLVLPFCGSGNMWIGIIASDGYSYYSNQINWPPQVSIQVGNDNGQMTVQLINFPLGLSYYFCHVGDPSGYPTGGAIASHGSFTVSSPGQSWQGGLCSGTGNAWIGIQATDGNSYYSNQVTLTAVPPTISAGNNDGQMIVELHNFPLGLSYYFCHVGDPSGYPTGGAIASHGSFTVSSPGQSWLSGLCSGTGNAWIGIQATDGNSYYSNQVVLGPPPAIVTAGLHRGVLAKPYSAVVKAAGGTGSYRWSITSGALPRGLSLAATGAITGTPRAAGTFTFVVSVTDADQYASSQPFTLRVAPLGVKTAGLPAGTLRKRYKATLAAYGGKAPLTWSIRAGHLPRGLKLSASGVITGIPTQAGTFTLTVKVTDAARIKHSATRSLTLTIKR